MRTTWYMVIRSYKSKLENDYLNRGKAINLCKIVQVLYFFCPVQGSHRISKTQFHDISMINNVISNARPPTSPFSSIFTMLSLTSVQQLVFWLLVVSSIYFTKFLDFSMIIQFFSNSMIFSMHGTFLVIFQVFHDFQSLWEPCQCIKTQPWNM